MTHYLIAAANAMQPLLVKQKPRLADLITAATIGCKTLETLVDDSEFKNHIKSLHLRSLIEDKDLADYKDLPVYARTLGHFSSFLAEERKLMTDRGIAHGLVNEICRQAEKLQRPMSNDFLDLNNLFVMIDLVRESTCDLSKSLNQGMNKSSINKARSTLLRAGSLLVGLALISPSVSDPNPLTISIALSYVLGQTLIGQSISSSVTPLNRTTQQNGARHLVPWRTALLIIIVMFVVVTGSNLIFYKIYTNNSSANQTPTAAVGTISPSYTLPFDTVKADFYTNPYDSGTFDRTPSIPFVFMQSFPAIAFNPETQNCSKRTGVTITTRPFTDIVQNPDGSCKEIPAEDGSDIRAHKAGLGNLQTFEVAYLTSVTVRGKGLLTMHITADDGWIISIGANNNGSQPTSEQTIMTHPRTDKKSPIENLPEMGDNDVPSKPIFRSIAINLPGAGTYPVEIDYTECCSGELTLVVTNDFTPNHP